MAFLLDVGETLQAAHGTRPILLTTADWVAIFIERNSRLLQEQFVFPQAGAACHPHALEQVGNASAR